jgi:YbbR domain-containing protein
MSIKKIILNNFLAKIMSLAFAVATWFYVFDLMNTEPYIQRKESSGDVFAKYDFEVKQVPVKPVFYGKPPRGYRAIFDKVKIEPSVMAVFGPKEVLSHVDELRTETIDLGEYTRSTQFKLGINSDVKYLRMDNKVVDVFVPIEAVGSDFSGK